jgi:hypothetical protein
MAKTLAEAKITTREQRRKLPVGVHWRGIDPNVHLGYRRGKRGGSWLVRWYDGKKYQYLLYFPYTPHYTYGYTL